MKHKVTLGDSGWLPHDYAFVPTKEAWEHAARTAKRDLGAYPHPNMKACTTLLKNYKTGRRVAFVTVGDFDARMTVDLLVHEAMHVWRDMREAIGEDAPSSEFEAYAIQNISASLFAAYEQTRGPLFVKPPLPSKQRKRPSGRGNA